MSRPTFSAIAQHFAPGWFAAVMGTGVLALTTATLGREWPLLSPVAHLLHLFNSLLFILLALPWGYRWLAFPAAARAALAHPVQSNFVPTFSIALLVLAAQWRTIGGLPEVALLLWWPGALLTYGFSLAILFQVFRGDSLTLDHVTPAHFIPAVGLVVMPLAGGPLLAEVEGLHRELLLTMNVLGLGAGSMMYLALLGITLYRKYLHKPAQGMLTPTVWIHLAPIGVIPVSLLNLLGALPFPAAREAALVVTLLVWGFGVWWLIMASLITLAAHRAGQLPFALSWWGFTFPLGAFVSESLRLHQELGWAGPHLIGSLAWLLLVALWSLTLINTLKGVISGRIFQPAP